jgi:voltage-gated potassium channel
VASIRASYGPLLTAIEWILTGLFTIEYLARLVAVRRPLAYVFSFYGIIDLLAVVPMYLELLLPGSHVLLVVRALRALRVFRILKLGRHLGEAQVLKNALRASRPKITVFLTFIISAVIIVGALMYLVEGPENGFPDILTSMYWAVVTLCTVGYGDIVPHTPLGKLIASLLMVMGYGVIAVPTGILSAELARLPRSVSGQSCPSCAWMDHEADAAHCKKCGAKL